MSDWNEKIIEEFRANDGVVGAFERQPLLLLHHVGARSGAQRVNPLAYRDLGDGSYAVFASKGGAPTNPAWYHNLLANPDTSVEVGTEVVDVTARVATGAERDRIWTAQKEFNRAFHEYDLKTDREIPVIILEPR